MAVVRECRGGEGQVTSVIIAAHNEEAVIGACLDALFVQTAAGPLHIVVSANGCTDATADVAHAREVTVVERSQPGKAAALNAGELVTDGFPRIYLDADIVVTPDALAGIIAALDDTPGMLAAVPWESARAYYTTLNRASGSTR